MNWSISKHKDWRNLEHEFSWVADMRGIPQDPIHHAEGDVAVHTSMVLDALLSLNEYRQLDGETQELMFAAALLHDVEKRSTTALEESGRITSHGHAKKGEFTSRQILFTDIPTPFNIRENICALVRYHGLPLWAMEKSNPSKAVIIASMRVHMPLLSMLAKADVLGRCCSDQRDLLDRIDLFEGLCQEQKCWDGPRAFVTDLSRFVYFQKEASSPDYVPFDDLKGEAILMSGLPGMGKDRYIQRNYDGLPIISLDDIRRKYKLKPEDSSATGWVVQEAKEQAKVFLRKGESFVWNATNVTRQMRTQLVDLFASYKARVKIVYLERPYQEWITQNRSREYPVPMNVMIRLLNKLEVPTKDEAHTVEFIA